MSDDRAPLRVVIAEDERPARTMLAALVRSFDEVMLVGEATNGAEAVGLIERERPDLALVDLQMPELDGLGVVRLVRADRLPLVAFVTAFDEYAVQAFEVNAVDYLLKPVERARLARTLDRARERLASQAPRAVEVARLRAAARAYEHHPAQAPLARIPVRHGEDIFLVPVTQLASIVADGELLHLTTLKNERYVINYRLKDLEARLGSDRFVRLERGALVNVSAITRVSPLAGGTYLVALHNGQEIRASRLQSRILRERLLRL